MQKGSVYKKKELLKLPSLKGQKKNKEEKKTQKQNITVQWDHMM